MLREVRLLRVSPGVGGFEGVDLPVPLLLQAARGCGSGAFGQGEEPVHPLSPGGRGGGRTRWTRCKCVEAQHTHTETQNWKGK